MQYGVYNYAFYLFGAVAERPVSPVFIYALLLAIGSLAGGPVAERGGDGLLALWAFLTLGSFASLVALLANMRPTRD